MNRSQFPSLYLPLLERIDEELRRGPLLLAIDGGSAAGKTTLGGLLQAVYGCPVFHTDDFFLRPEQRSPQRLAEPGGNMDRERFLAEVLQPLRQGLPVCYRPFSCRTMCLGEPVTVVPGPLNVVEGAYCMHPELADFYDLRVFLAIAPELQRRRIQKRNPPEKAALFFSRWIPMEQRYFDAMAVKERCQLVFSSEDTKKEC